MDACQEEAFFRIVGAAYHPHVVVWQYCLNDPDEAYDPLAAATVATFPLPLSWNRALASSAFSGAGCGKGSG